MSRTQILARPKSCEAGVGLFYNGSVTQTFSTDSRGRLVVTSRMPKRAYVIPPDRAWLYIRVARFYNLAFFVVFPVCAVQFYPYGQFAVLLLWVAGVFLFHWLLTRDLEPTSDVLRRPTGPRPSNRAGTLTLAALGIATWLGLPLLGQLPRPVRMVVGGAVYAFVLWLLFGSPRKPTAT